MEAGLLVTCAKSNWTTGRSFLQKHAADAKSWNLWMTHDMLRRLDVFTIVEDRCLFGLWCSDADGSALVERPTVRMTNSKRLVAALDRKVLSEASTLSHEVLCLARPSTLDRRELNSVEVGQNVDGLDVWLTHPEFSPGDLQRDHWCSVRPEARANRSKRRDEVCR